MTTTTTAQKIAWEDLGNGDYNPNFSGYTVGYQCTGQPRSGFVLYSRGPGACWNQRTKPQFSPAPGMKPVRIGGEWVWARDIAQLAIDCAYACSQDNGPEANAKWILSVLERAGI